MMICQLHEGLMGLGPDHEVEGNGNGESPSFLESKNVLHSRGPLGAVVGPSPSGASTASDWKLWNTLTTSFGMSQHEDFSPDPSLVNGHEHHANIMSVLPVYIGNNDNDSSHGHEEVVKEEKKVQKVTTAQQSRTLLPRLSFHPLPKPPSRTNSRIRSSIRHQSGGSVSIGRSRNENGNGHTYNTSTRCADNTSTNAPSSPPPFAPMTRAISPIPASPVKTSCGLGDENENENEKVLEEKLSLESSPNPQKHSLLSIRAASPMPLTPSKGNGIEVCMKSPRQDLELDLQSQDMRTPKVRNKKGMDLAMGMLETETEAEAEDENDEEREEGEVQDPRSSHGGISASTHSNTSLASTSTSKSCYQYPRKQRYQRHYTSQNRATTRTRTRPRRYRSDETHSSSTGSHATKVPSLLHNNDIASPLRFQRYIRYFH